jgi:hypothetical protein
MLGSANEMVAPAPAFRAPLKESAITFGIQRDVLDSNRIKRLAKLLQISDNLHPSFSPEK